MAEVEETSVPVLAVTAAVGAIVLLLVLLCGIGKKGNEKERSREENSEANGPSQERKAQPAQAKRKEKPKFLRKESKHVFTHSWLATSLKGHSASVLGLDFSPNEKYLASCAEDRTVLLWNVKDFKQKQNKSTRANVELDHATKVRFSPDSKAFITSLFNENTVRVFKMGKKSDGSLGNIQGAFDFPKAHGNEIINIGIASSGKFIMTCSKETTIRVWDLKGEPLGTIETHQVNTAYGAVSPCGRFVASSGFTPDVKVWEVVFDKVGAFKEIIRAFELKGHTSGVYHFSFSANSARMASISKDGTWKLWNTNIEYHHGQEPYLLQTGKYDHTGPSLIALSPDGRAVSIATGTNISMYNALTAELAQTFEEVHSSPIKAMEFNISGEFLLSTGDKHIQVFHNVVGYRATVQDLEEKKKKATTSAMRERIQQQIDDARASLQKFENGSQEQ